MHEDALELDALAEAAAADEPYDELYDVFGHFDINGCDEDDAHLPAPPAVAPQAPPSSVAPTAAADVVKAIRRRNLNWPTHQAAPRTTGRAKPARPEPVTLDTVLLDHIPKDADIKACNSQLASVLPRYAWQVDPAHISSDRLILPKVDFEKLASTKVTITAACSEKMIRLKEYRAQARQLQGTSTSISMYSATDISMQSTTISTSTNISTSINISTSTIADSSMNTGTANEEAAAVHSARQIWSPPAEFWTALVTWVANTQWTIAADRGNRYTCAATWMELLLIFSAQTGVTIGGGRIDLANASRVFATSMKKVLTMATLTDGSKATKTFKTTNNIKSIAPLTGFYLAGLARRPIVADDISFALG